MNRKNFLVQKSINFSDCLAPAGQIVAVQQCGESYILHFEDQDGNQRRKQVTSKLYQTWVTEPPAELGIVQTLVPSDKAQV